MPDGGQAPTDAPDSPWNLLADFSKTIISLSSGLLAVTVTFSANFLKGDHSKWAILFLALAWSFLIVATVLALIAAGAVVNYLRGKNKEQTAILFNNTAFYALATAGALFVAAGVSQVTHRGKPLDAAEVARCALKLAPTLARNTPNAWVVTSLFWNQQEQVYDLSLRQESLGFEYAMLIDAEGRVIQVRRRANLAGPSAPPSSAPLDRGPGNFSNRSPGE